MTVRVVLVEDHALFRAGVRAELADPAVVGDGTPRVEIVGEAASVEMCRGYPLTNPRRGCST